MQTEPHLFCDMDGTFINSLGIYYSVGEAFAKSQGLSYDYKKMVSGYSRPDEVDMGWGIPLHQQKDMYALQTQYHIEQMTVHNKFLPILFDGISDTLAELAEKGYGMSIVTANTRSVSEVYLQKNNIRNYFSDMRTLTCAQECGYKVKPSPEAISRAAKEKNINLDYALVIGDSPHDLLMARDAGIKSIAVTWGGTSRDDLAKFNPTDIVSDIRHLPKAIQRLMPN